MVTTATIPDTTIASVKSSYSRCMIKGVIDKFYQKFLASHPSIGPRFKQTDFAKQKDLLKHGIHLLIMHASGKEMGTQGLSRIRESHAKSRLNITPDLYGHWLSSFMATLAELDPQWSKELKAQWESVLNQGIDYIKSGYQA